MIQTLILLFLVLLLWVFAWQLRSVALRQSLLLVASYAFYASWGIGFLCVLIVSSLLNYICGLALHRKITLTRLWIGIGLNLILLGGFKYLPPFLQVASLGQDNFVNNIIMPVGMSFWTFQGLSYLWDIYLEEEIDPSLLEFCLYMAFWPTVFSGPVCRVPNMLPQFRQQPVFLSSNISAGLLRVIEGLVMKFVLAQLLGNGLRAREGVIAGFDQFKAGWGALDVWLLGIGYGFQLYFDFAGYSHMVIGTAGIFGIRLPENFNRPFLSITPSVFWTRWHMSLSFWIRDYVFNPLAAAGRRYRWWPYIVFVISMTLFGFWHGAKWTFIAFGVYHGFVLVIHRIGQQLKQRFSVRPPQYLALFFSWGTTFLLISIGFVLFRANDLTQAWSMLRAIFSPSAYAHFAMPSSFYYLISIVATGYFLVAAGNALLFSCRARYLEAISKVSGATQVLHAAPPRTLTLIIGGLFDFSARRLWWWFAPALSIVAILVGIATYKQATAFAVTPFMYTIF